MRLNAIVGYAFGARKLRAFTKRPAMSLGPIKLIVKLPALQPGCVLRTFFRRSMGFRIIPKKLHHVITKRDGYHHRRTDHANGKQRRKHVRESANHKFQHTVILLLHLRSCAPQW